MGVNGPQYFANQRKIAQMFCLAASTIEQQADTHNSTTSSVNKKWGQGAWTKRLDKVL